MVDQVIPPRHGGEQPLHPFFQANKPAVTGAAKASSTKDPRGSTTNTPISSFDGATDDGSEDSETSAKRGGQRWKRSKLDSQVPEDEQKQRVTKRIKTSNGGNITDHFARLHDGNASSLSAIDESRQQSGDEVIGRHGNEHILAPNTTYDIQQTPSINPSGLATSNADPPRPTKVIRLNLKTGTLGSPPKPKASITEVERVNRVTKKAPLNGRGKKNPSRILRIKYGTHVDSRIRIGDNINAILNSPQTSSTGSSSATKPQRLNVSPKPTKKADYQPPKTTHPFFLGNPKPSKPSPELAGPEPEFSKVSRMGESMPVDNALKRVRVTSTRIPQFGVKNTGLKVPGSKLPAWPWKDMVHVRGEDSGASFMPEEPTPSLSSRKSKGRAVEIPARESVVEYVTRRLDIPTLEVAAKNMNADDFLPPPPVIRPPQKHFESGRKLQRRILPELRCSKQMTIGRKGVGGQTNVLDHPPQLLRLFNSIQSELPAIDRSECETISWAQKYTPISAAEVLQPGREAFFLKDWLQALMIQSVDTGPGESEKGKGSLPKSKASGPTKKKRRKKLDGFIVSSDEEGDQMGELSETEGDWAASGTHGILKKTVIRAGDLKGKSALKDSSRLANTVVISGPHGSGKTAAVYAVAKELGFEVFEINSSSRRSGKDVLDRIGDMTRNHLVSHQRRSNTGIDMATNTEISAETKEDTATLESGAAEDIKSGKQATMGSFFKPKAVGNPEKPTKQAVTCPPQKELGKDGPKGQKQSLILLDEADILYEEDKQFWASVIGLIAQSRRPFVVTCNDETLLPFQSLTLHGIFRLSHPPTDLAVDRLILIAANEGHALRRDAVEALFESRNRDLRAATMDLNYWCQIGVGDRRGGFDWFYLRWPKGIDLDENKEVVRVVSEGTYRPGMNWLVRDHVVDNAAHPALVEEELLQQVWSSWSLDIDQWHGSASMLPWTKGLSTVTSEPGGRLAALEAFDQFAEAMSASDICSNAFGRSIEEPIDATLPGVSSKARDDYISGRQLLDTPPVIHYDSLFAVLPTAMKSMARAVLQSGISGLSQQPTLQLSPLVEGQLLNIIRPHFTSPSTGGTTISRIDFSLAFDPIAASDSPQPSAALSYLDPSVFDRTMKLVTLDVAPYVRGIVAYETHLQKQRLKRSNLVSEGGRGGKRMRTTRAAYSALEGGSRSTTRAERWFMADLNPHLVFKTGGDGWDKLVIDSTNSQIAGSPKARKEYGARRATRALLMNDSEDELS